MAANNKHHIRKLLSPKPWDIDFPGDSSKNSSRIIIKMKMGQNLRNFFNCTEGLPTNNNILFNMLNI